MKESLNLNIGSHNKKIDGWLSVDGLDLEHVDVVFDYNNLEFGPSPFEDESVDKIMAIEFLEHISFRMTYLFLKDCFRVLKPLGTVHFQVPAIDKMCEMFVRGQVCDCIPHKVQKGSVPRANSNCFKCEGEALVNSNRWRIAFSGAQKHEFDNHLNHFTKDILYNDLERSGFGDIDITYEMFDWKLKATAVKPKLI